VARSSGDQPTRLAAVSASPDQHRAEQRATPGLRDSTPRANRFDVPVEIGYRIAAQLDVAASCLARYGEREKTRLEHQWEIAREYGFPTTRRRPEGHYGC
jgi:hypothetical protein